MKDLIANQFSLPNIDKFFIKAEGRIELNLFKTSDAPKIVCELEDEWHSAKIVENKIILTNNYKDSIAPSEFDQTRQAIEHKESFLNILSSVVSDVYHISNKRKQSGDNHTLIVNIYLNENTSLDISGDNYTFNLSNVILDNVKIDCSNAHFHGDNYSIKSLIIDTSNISGTFLFNEQNGSIKLETNNGKIEIVKGNFNGKIAIQGNNLKINYAEPDIVNSEYKFLGHFNNGKVNVR